MTDKTAKIRELNDLLRGTFLPQLGRVVLTEGIRDHDKREDFLTKVREFKDFTDGDDPYGEHDFGAIEVNGEKAFFKIDYYDKAFEYGSEDPADPKVTGRVLTIMLAAEY
jgi:hypothetical protein